MKFVLEIEMGNDAVQTPRDVAFVLKRAAVSVSRVEDWHESYKEARILDANGNTIGQWEIRK